VIACNDYGAKEGPEVEVAELLKGHWWECSGGSRQGNSKIRFLGVGRNTVLIEMWYVFDLDTNETQSFAFRISRREYNRLIEGLLQRGQASLDKSGKDQELHFEWRGTQNGFAFRLAGRTATAYEGTGLEIAELMTVDCGKLY
jgi:hypothetical protein